MTVHLVNLTNPMGMRPNFHELIPSQPQVVATIDASATAGESKKPETPIAAPAAAKSAEQSPAVRRIADSAWAGGATPIVVVSFDPDGQVAAALAGAPVTLAEPAPAEQGPAAQMARGARSTGASRSTASKRSPAWVKAAMRKSTAPAV